jgi:hypothetical protein
MKSKNMKGTKVETIGLKGNIGIFYCMPLGAQELETT